MSEAGGASGRTSFSAASYTLAAFNAAAAIFVGITAMRGDETKASLDRLTSEIVQLRVESRDLDRRLARAEALVERERRQ